MLFPPFHFNKIGPFDKENKELSLFVIASPLQALCLYEVIKVLRLDNYYILVIAEQDDCRIAQIEETLKAFGYSYKLARLNHMQASKNIIGISKDCEGFTNLRFKRVFVGDYYNTNALAFALHYSCNHANIVYLDDGNSTVEVFSGQQHYLQKKDKMVRTLFEAIASLRGISHNKYFFSIYYKQFTDKYIVYKNDFSNIRGLIRERCLDGGRELIFIGSNSLSFCEGFHISIEQYYDMLLALLSELSSQYPDKHLVYIPHGRETLGRIKDICSECGFDYLPLKVPIELYVLQNGIIPFMLAAFSSSALFNLKTILPEIFCVNYLLNLPESKIYKSYEFIACIYESSGILTKKIDA